MLATHKTLGEFKQEDIASIWTIFENLREETAHVRGPKGSEKRALEGGRRQNISPLIMLPGGLEGHFTFQTDKERVAERMPASRRCSAASVIFYLDPAVGDAATDRCFLRALGMLGSRKPNRSRWRTGDSSQLNQRAAPAGAPVPGMVPSSEQIDTDSNT